MVTQELRSAVSLRCQFLEKIGQRYRIDPRFPQNDGSDPVGLCLITARIFEQQRSRSNLDSGLRRGSGGASQRAGGSSGEPRQALQQR